jgi:hypothetical protein
MLRITYRDHAFRSFSFGAFSEQECTCSISIRYAGMRLQGLRSPAAWRSPDIADPDVKLR